MSKAIHQKIEMLAAEAAKVTEGARETDINKLTPKGVELVANARREARKRFAETGEREWLKAGQMIGDSFGKKQKPAPRVDFK